MPGLRYFTLMLCCAGFLGAQPTWTSVRITTDPPALVMTVDGVEYSGLTSFSWRVGSTHELAIDLRRNRSGPGARYAFAGWIDSTGHPYGGATTIMVTADPAVTAFVASYTAEYSLDVSFFHCAYSVPANCGPLPGTVYIDGTPYWRDVELWFPAGTEVNLEAVANLGFAFAGWDNRFANPRSPVQTLGMNSGWTIQTGFVVSRTVTIGSSPPGLKLAVDGGIIISPRDFGWADGTGHTLVPFSPQADESGEYWVFDSWSNGGAQQQEFTVASTPGPQAVTARYVAGVIATILTEPVGLKVKVDGSDAWSSPNFVWGAGSTHQVSAPLEQTDSAGRRYGFRGCSDGSQDAARNLTVTEAVLSQGLRLAARYQPLDKLTVESTPVGVSVLVDGTGCLTPCAVDRSVGARVTISAPASAPVGLDTRLEFEGWQDQASRERVWTITAEPQRISAVYRTMYRIQATADPAGGALFRFEPASADAFYAVGTQVVGTAEARPGFRFRRWGGDLGGTLASGALMMTQPRSVIAQLDRVPYIPPAGVVNAAGPTPDDGVAAGSIIAIYGENLAPDTVTGPPSPLAQTLAGVTVQVDDRLLPLFFVSGQQINALLPSDLEPGGYSLTIHSSRQPGVSAAFQVIRNAPGLFANQIDSLAYAAAIHPDGSLVLPSNPARPGELITLYGTGFGPYLPSPLDGFPVPPEAVFPLVDAVEILLGEVTITPQWVRAAVGSTGVTAVSLQVPDEAPPSGSPQVKVRIYTRESNSVILPLEH